MFYTWQYDVRWAATTLRRTGKLRAAEVLPSGVWELRSLLFEAGIGVSNIREQDDSH